MRRAASETPLGFTCPLPSQPKVAAARQPWAILHKPFGLSAYAGSADGFCRDAMQTGYGIVRVVHDPFRRRRY